MLGCDKDCVFRSKPCENKQSVQIKHASNPELPWESNKYPGNITRELYKENLRGKTILSELSSLPDLLDIQQTVGESCFPWKFICTFHDCSAKSVRQRSWSGIKVEASGARGEQRWLVITFKFSCNFASSCVHLNSEHWSHLRRERDTELQLERAMTSEFYRSRKSFQCVNV